MFESIRRHSGPAISRLCCAALFSLCVAHPAAFAQPSDLTAVETAREPLGVVNLNTASAQELERLPGIGPARAQAILALRQRLTQFSRLEQLLRVKGIGRATFRKLRPMLTLSGPTTLRTPKRGRTP